MTDIVAREGDRCAECGTPLEPVEIAGATGEESDQLVLRCANGHVQPVTRHDSPGTEGGGTARS